MPYAERKAQIRVHPISSNGEVRVTFTKPVDWPNDFLSQIYNFMNVTFEPKTYDYEADEEEIGKNTTQLKSWSVKTVESTTMLLKLEFEDPDMIGYSIFESDEVTIEFDFRSVFMDGDQGDKLYGKFIKPLPL